MNEEQGNEEQNIKKEQDLSSQSTEQSTTEATKKLSPVGDLLSQSFSAYKSIFWKLIGMTLLPLLSAMAIALLFLAYMASNFFLNQLVIANIINIVLGLFGLVLIVVFVIVSYISKAGVYVLVRDYQKQLSIKEAFFVAKKSTWGFVTVSISIGLFVLLWSFLFIIPGLIMMIFYSMAIWSYFYEGFTGTSALKRSKELVKGYFWSLVFRYSLIIVGIVLFLYLPPLLINSLAFASSWSALGNIVSFLVAPFLVVMNFNIFLDLKSIKGESRIEKK